jgi:hypothetical protein
MASMVQRVVHAVSLRRYQQFQTALVVLDEVLEDAQKVAARLDDLPVKLPWWAADADDVRKAIRKTENSLRILAKSSRRWRGELLSRKWR